MSVPSTRKIALSNSARDAEPYSVIKATNTDKLEE
jgi:hypothetical protein